MHRRSEREVPLKVQPKGRAPEIGLFASRSRSDPTRSAKVQSGYSGVNANILTVQGLDAIDGTPIIDVKPFMPGYDSVDDAKVPRWLTKK